MLPCRAAPPGPLISLSNQPNWITFAALLLVVAAVIVVPVVGIVRGSPALLTAIPVVGVFALVGGLFRSRFNLSLPPLGRSSPPWPTTWGEWGGLAGIVMLLQSISGPIVEWLRHLWDVIKGPWQ